MHCRVQQHETWINKAILVVTLIIISQYYLLQDCMSITWELEHTHFESEKVACVVHITVGLQYLSISVSLQYLKIAPGPCVI